MTGDTVLFLDFDGVLNSEGFLRWQRNHSDEQKPFDAENIDALNSLIQRLGISRIVVSSSWKIGRSLDELRSLLCEAGMEYSEYVTDVTAGGSSGSEGRAEEILEAISRLEISDFLILDDFNLSEYFDERFYRVDSSKGLEMALVETILADFVGLRGLNQSELK